MAEGGDGGGQGQTHRDSESAERGGDARGEGGGHAVGGGGAGGARGEEQQSSYVLAATSLLKWLEHAISLHAAGEI